MCCISKFENYRMVPTSVLVTVLLVLTNTLASPEAVDRNQKELTLPKKAFRSRRSYSRWADKTDEPVQYESFTRWKPAAYSLNRPYFIPVYGVPGRIPIFFPPQPILLNPGTPIDNPRPNKPFAAPGYLPPYPPKKTTTMNPFDINDRFGEDGHKTTEPPIIFDDDDERPLWGMDFPAKPSSTSKPEVPTRRPRPPSSTLPPLIHDTSKAGGGNQLSANDINEPRPNQSPPMGAAAQQPAGPGRCAWAIVTCCSAQSTEYVGSCFESRGCPGPFWDSSPCESDFARAAIESALNYYNTN